MENGRIAIEGKVIVDVGLGDVMFVSLKDYDKLKADNERLREGFKNQGHEEHCSKWKLNRAGFKEYDTIRNCTCGLDDILNNKE